MLVPAKVPKEDIEQKKSREIKREIRKDMSTIDSVEDSEQTDVIVQIHQYLDGKYNGHIKGWGNGMYGYNAEFGFNYELLGIDSLKNNLHLMKAKLEGFMIFHDEPTQPTRITDRVVTNINNTINTQLNVNIAIEEAQRNISELTALSSDQIEEINNKLGELKKIVESEEKKNTKWEKAKPIFKYIIDKGLDVAKIVLPLIQNI